MLVRDARAGVQKLLGSVARRIPNELFKIVRHRHIVLPHREAEHVLQRPRDGIAMFGALQRLETEADDVGGGRILGVLPDEGVAEVDGAEEMERCYVRTRIDIPILREENDTLLSMLDDDVSEIILRVLRLFQFQERLEKINERRVILDTESHQPHFHNRSYWLVEVLTGET